MKLHAALAEANQAGRLGLILYVIPNYPNPDEFATILKGLSKRPEISVVEMTFPVDTGFSEHANQTIRRAHQQAASHERDYTRVLAQYRYGKPSLCVLYKSTSDDHGFATVMEKMSGRVDGVILEWSENEHRKYFDVSKRTGVELVQCVGPWMKEAEMTEILSFCKEKPLVYLMSAPMTGAKLFSREELERTIAISKRIRPDMKIAAGFGVKTAEDVRQLAQVRGLDAAIIGTAFIERMSHGALAVERYLDTIEEALSYA